MSKILIQLKKAVLAYGRRPGQLHIIGPLDMEVYEDEALGIIGESGAGKSTAALYFLGMLHHKGGAKISGEIHSEIAPEKIAYIPQDPLSALDPLFSIGDQLSEGGTSKPQILEALEKVRLPLKNISLKSYPHELSGGMRQRVVIAMALLRKPGLIIADEPTSSLDMTLQAEIMKLFSEFRRGGMPFIFISHNLPLAANFCDRLIVMRQGKIVETGTPQKIMEAAENAYTRELVRALPEILR